MESFHDHAPQDWKHYGVPDEPSLGVAFVRMRCARPVPKYLQCLEAIEACYGCHAKNLWTGEACCAAM